MVNVRFQAIDQNIGFRKKKSDAGEIVLTEMEAAHFCKVGLLKVGRMGASFMPSAQM